jgi:hypothetical protein
MMGRNDTMTTVENMTVTATKMTYLRNAAGEFVCPDCGITKKRQNTMFYHMKKHAGELSHVCSVCSKGFIQKSGLQQHMVQAHPEAAAAAGCAVTEYACPCCDHTCRVKSNLFIHIARKHGSGWVPAASGATTCSCCAREFSSATAYYYHAVFCFADVAPAAVVKGLDEILGCAT